MEKDRPGPVRRTVWSMDRPFRVMRAGRTDYETALALQRRLRAERFAGGPDWLVLTEHEPVFTLGRAHPEPRLRVAMAVLEAEGIPIMQTERGGDITYHGPGQLVGYVIVGLRERGLSVLDLVSGLEDVAIAVAARWGVEAGRDARNRGAWVGGRKLASIGVHVSRGVSMHGIAINVDPDTAHWRMIDACGLGDVEMTGLVAEARRPVPMNEVEGAFEEEFSRVFGVTLTRA